MLTCKIFFFFRLGTHQFVWLRNWDFIFVLFVFFTLSPALSAHREAPNPPGGAITTAMANVIMASSKTQIPISSSLPAPKPKSSTIPQFSLPKLPKPQPLSILSSSSSAALKSIYLVGAAAPLLLTPLPALAVEIEKAALFDFNLTLPIIMGEFLLLMFALDKIFFTPLGKFMDERDAAIKEKLNSVKDTSEEVNSRSLFPISNSIAFVHVPD